MSGIDQKAAEKLYMEHGMNLTRAAAAAGMVRSTFTRLLRSKGAPELPRDRLEFLRSRVAELERSQRKTLRSEGELLETLDGILKAVKQAEPPAPVKSDPQARASPAPCEMVVHVTDWHYGRMQASDEIEGFNEYSPEVARARVAELTRKLLRKAQVQRAGYNVPKLRIICTGDMISGDIHDELRASNAFPAPQQAVECGYLFGAFVSQLSASFEETEVDFVTLDNHGRLTRKPQSTQGGINSWGYIVGEVARRFVTSLPSVRFHLHTCPLAVVKVGPEKYLCFHGHQIKGFHGIPCYGLDRRVALEAIRRMGMPEVEFTKMLTGHLHVAFNAPKWGIGGSLSGTDTFDHNQGRHAPAHQSSWFVHPEHGEFDWTRWVLT